VSEQTVQTLIVALLGTGGAAFIWTVAKSIIAFRHSAEGREDKAVARLEKFEEACRDQLREERAWGSHWQRRSATLEYLLRQNGIPVPEDPGPQV
jgi:hypothetical protein